MQLYINWKHFDANSRCFCVFLDIIFVRQKVLVLTFTPFPCLHSRGWERMECCRSSNRIWQTLQLASPNHFFAILSLQTTTWKTYGNCNDLVICHPAIAFSAFAVSLLGFSVSSLNCIEYFQGWKPCGVLIGTQIAACNDGSWTKMLILRLHWHPYYWRLCRQCWLNTI